MSDQRNQVIKSAVRWSVVDQLVQQVLGFLINIVLLRLLVPGDFGQIIMITAFLGVVGLLKDPGLSSAFVQQKSVDKNYANSIFWLLVLINIILFLFLLLMTEPIVHFYQSDSDFANVYFLLIVSFFISSFSIFPQAQLVKKIDFKVLFYAKILSQIIGGGIAIYSAWKGYGVYSIVMKGLIAEIVMVSFLWLTIPWMPSFSWSKSTLTQIRNYSLPLLGDSLLNYVVRNVDDVMVGKIWGQASLGIYNRAYSIMLLPVRKLAGVAARLLFPLLSSLQDNDEETRRIFLLNVQVIALIAFPLMSFLGMETEGIVFVVLGKQWLEMVPILRILAFLGAIQSIGTLVGTIYTARGGTRLQFRVGIVVKSFLILIILIGVHQGIEKLTLFYALGSFIAFFLEYYYAGQLIQLTLSNLLSKLAPFLVASLFVCCGLSTVDFFLDLTVFNLLLALLMKFTFSLLIYCFCLYLFIPKELKTIYFVAKKIIK
ncbi:lipopolysaccharide biosynthesis protein [Lewinella sp. LCG006]|uniref:lipopolysaccharide biosynthesis protein n=1 Tax=Lewinella sp. LCG006 TaxID=3231911 RepID=UPI003460E4A2